MKKDTLFKCLINPPTGNWLSYLFAGTGILIFAIGMGLNDQDAEKVQKLQTSFSQQLQSEYGLSADEVKRSVCSQGKLFYPAPGIFSGYLPYTPELKCSQAQFDAIQRAKTDKSADQLLAFLGFVIYVLGVGWRSYLKKLNKQEASK